MILIAEHDIPERERLATLLADLGPTAGVAAPAEADRELSDPGSTIDVLLTGPSVPTDEALQVAGWLASRGSHTGVVAVVASLDAEVLRGALRAGVRDVLPADCSDEQLREAVGHAATLSRQRRSGDGTIAEPGAGNRIITVFSTKGGCGKSTVASNLALLLRRSTGESVGLVDLDLQSGDAALMLQLMPSWTIYDAVENLDQLDIRALQGYLTGHKSGLSVLAAPLEPALAEAISPGAVEHILRLMREQFTYTVVDGPAFFTDQVLAAFDHTDDVVLVASLDVPSVKNLKLATQTFQQLGIARDRLHIILNRADSKVGLRIQEVEKTLGTTVDVAIPSSREVPLSVNQGTPLAESNRKSEVVHALERLVERVRVRTEPDIPQQTGLRKLIGRK